MADRCIFTIGVNVVYGEFWDVQPDLLTAMGLAVNCTDIAATPTTYATYTFQTFPRLSTSPDGVDWTRQTSFTDRWTEFASNGNIRQIKAFGTKFVVVGDHARIMQSDDEGVTWVRNVGFGSVHASASIQCIGFDGTKYIAVAANGLCASSTDLTTWTDVPGFSSSGWGTQLAEEIIYADGQWSVCGPNGGVNTSTDGITWTYRTIADIPGAKTLTFVDMAYGNGTWVIVGEQCLCATSTDGETWTYTGTLDSSGWGSSKVFGVCFDGSQFVAVGDSGRIATSPDGLVWTYNVSLISDIAWTTGYDAWSVTSLPSGVLCISGQGSLAANSATTDAPPVPEVQYLYHLANLDTVLRRYPIDGGGDMGVSDASIDLVAYLSPASGHDVTLFTDGTDIYVFQEKDAYNATVLVKVDKALTTVSASRSNVQGADPIGVCPSGFLVRNGLVSNLDVLHPTTLADVSSERIDFSGAGRAPNVNGVKCTQAMMDANPWIGLFSSPTYWYAPVDVNNIGGVGYDCDELSAWDYSAYAENNIGMPDNSTVVTRTGVVINRNTGAIINSFTPYSLLSPFTPWQEYNGVDLYKVGYGGALRRLADYKNSAGGDGNYNVVSGITMASEIDAILIA